jgi:hypothetical protein
MSNRIKSERVNLGLELLAARSKPRQNYSCEEIAAWCDCSFQAIETIERKAIAKIRTRIRLQLGLSNAEFYAERAIR